MTRVVSLFLPTWPTDRLHRQEGASLPPELPLAVIGHGLLGGGGRRRVVTAANIPAQVAGLRIGMAATTAQILLPGLAIREADPGADRAALDRLALWILNRYAPVVAADPPDGIVIESTGSDHLHGGEAAMLADLVTRLSQVGIVARAALADSWGAAHALARYGFAARTAISDPDLQIRIDPPGGGGRAIADLPVPALRLPLDMVTELHRLGFDRIGELAAQPRAPLALRFGPELGRRLDQAFGRLAEPFEPIRPPDPITTRRSFAEPIAAAETIARYIGKLVEPLCAQLEARGMGARRLDLLCHRVDNRIEALRIGLGSPVRAPERLTKLLCARIETLDPGFGIETMVLTASRAEPFDTRQLAASILGETPPEIGDLIDTLANRLGEHRIYRVEPVPSDLPERSLRRLPPQGPPRSVAIKNRRRWPNHWPRPARLFSQPEPIETMALLPDHPPAFFIWRGERHRVSRADGPERVFGEWWKRDAELDAVRDYFRVEDEAGSRFWIFRAGDGEDAATGSQRWFLHGLFG